MVVACAEPRRIILTGVFLLPDDIRYKIGWAEHLVAQQSQMTNLSIVDADEDHSVASQELSQEFQSREHHAQPFVMA